MSYKTNAKTLRLGVSHSWVYKANGPTKDFQLDHKVRRYLTNLIEYVVPQAPKKVNTKARKERKYPTQPGLQGKTIVLRRSNILSIVCFYYLNYDGAAPQQISDFHKNMSKIKHTINNETGYKVNLKMINYFIFFWRYEAFIGVNTPFRMRQKVNKCIAKFDYIKIEKDYYTLLRKKINSVRRAVRRFKRQRYFRRTFYPLVSSFLFFDFDSEMAAKTIALELQMLRIEHKKFIYYVRKFFQVSYKIWNKKFQIIHGLQIKVNGRMTDFRRQVRRTQTKIINIGIIKRSDTNYESGHTLAIAYNRYGTISVQVSYQLNPLVAERWEERTPFSPQLNFSTNAFIELYSNMWDVEKKNVYSRIKWEKKEIINQKLTKISDIHKKYIEFKKNTVIFKNHPLSQAKTTRLKLIFTDPKMRAKAPLRPWNEKGIFKKYLLKKINNFIKKKDG